MDIDCDHTVHRSLNRLCHTSFVCLARQHTRSSASALPSRLCYLGEDDTVVRGFPRHAAKHHV